MYPHGSITGEVAPATRNAQLTTLLGIMADMDSTIAEIVALASVRRRSHRPNRPPSHSSGKFNPVAQPARGERWVLSGDLECPRRGPTVRVHVVAGAPRLG